MLGPGAPRVKEVVTPEGVPLRLALAGAGDRAAALLLDAIAMLLLVLGIVAVVIAIAAIGGGTGAALAGAVGLVAFFLVRTFYFTWFEVRWNGMTPGKARLGIRVVDARGGALGVEAVVARNLMREVEVFLPAIVLFAPEALWPGAPEWLALLAAGWILAFAFLPLLNRDRVRAGDLIAGTVVIAEPKVKLLADLGARAAKEEAAAYAFTPEQLEIYGIYELQVLEDLLRRAEPDRRALSLVREKIQKKIGWPRDRGDVDPKPFLRAFYAAQRARLERKLLLGERKERKAE